jgi:ABC-type antimicrobial peptide transport system permease subunit
MLWVFGGMGGAVVALSLYGVLALDVRRRRDEMALRRAVGAAPAGLVSMVLRDGVRIAMPGLMLGLGGTAVLSERMAGLLGPALKPDATVFVTAGVVVLSVVVLAAMLPAARAASTDAARELGRDG